MKQIRIGSGAGYAGDRIEPAIDLIRRGNLDYIIFECLAERTISIAQKKKLGNPQLGYNDLLEERFQAIFSVYAQHPVKIITNMGAANPQAAAARCSQLAREQGLSGLKIAWVSGDDMTARLEEYQEETVLETGRPLKEIHGEILSANGYIGCQGIVEALTNGADIIITGRVADPALVVGPLVHEFGWSLQDFDHLGKATLVGHLLECAGQVTGGYFADPGYKEVPELWNLGFPIAVVEESGDAVITKLPGTGGIVSEDTVKEQMLYEIQDPASYFTPDVIADFSNLRAQQVGPDQVRVSGAAGRQPNGFYKTSVGYHDCTIGEGQISYGGANALARAQLAKEVLEHRFAQIALKYSEIRYDFLGVNSLYQNLISQTICPNAAPPAEVRLRVAARCDNPKEAEKVGNEVEALYTNGPCGGGGAAKSVRDIISIASILIPREDFSIEVHFVEE